MELVTNIVVPKERRLNVGCGKTVLPDWTNLDVVKHPGVDVQFDLNTLLMGTDKRLPFEDNTFEEMQIIHTLEHLFSPLGVMEELYRIAKPDCKMEIHVPYGSSDGAFEDPQHIHYFFLKSFIYFAQPTYWRASYGYMADWETTKRQLLLLREEFEEASLEDIHNAVRLNRNIVIEYRIFLKAIKPARPQDRSLITDSPIDFVLISRSQIK